MGDKVGWLARTGERADYPRYFILSHGAGAGIAPTCRGIFFLHIRHDNLGNLRRKKQRTGVDVRFVTSRLEH